jgi:co-chaperonin GroES (HSP10)
MRLSELDGIMPIKDKVLVSIFPVSTNADGIVLYNERSEDQAKMYFGEVLSMGPDVALPKHCPGLKVGDKIFFSEFAGHHISTKQNKLVKIIRGYDIMTTLEDIDKIEDSNTTPTADRVLVAAKYRDDSDDGLSLNAEEARDPSLADLDYGVVLKKGPSCTDPKIEVGMTVAYAPYVGECLKKQPKEGVAEYRVLLEQDVLFTLA